MQPCFLGGVIKSQLCASSPLTIDNWSTMAASVVCIGVYAISFY